MGNGDLVGQIGEAEPSESSRLTHDSRPSSETEIPTSLLSDEQAEELLLSHSVGPARDWAILAQSNDASSQGRRVSGKASHAQALPAAQAKQSALTPIAEHQLDHQLEPGSHCRRLLSRAQSLPGLATHGCRKRKGLPDSIAQGLAWQQQHCAAREGQGTTVLAEGLSGLDVQASQRHHYGLSLGAADEIPGRTWQAPATQLSHLGPARPSAMLSPSIATRPTEALPDHRPYAQLQAPYGQLLDIDPPDNFDPFNFADTIDQAANVLPSTVLLRHTPADSSLLGMHSPHGPARRDDFLPSDSPQLDQLGLEQLAWLESSIGTASPQMDLAMPHGLDLPGRAQAVNRETYSLEPVIGQDIQHGPALAAALPVSQTHQLYGRRVDHSGRVVQDPAHAAGPLHAQDVAKYPPHHMRALSHHEPLTMQQGHSPTSSTTVDWRRIEHTPIHVEARQQQQQMLRQAEQKAEAEPSQDGSPGAVAGAGRLGNRRFGGISSSIISSVKKGGDQPVGIFRLEDMARSAEQKRMAEQPAEQARFDGVQRQPWGVLYTATLVQARSKRQARIGPFASPQEAASSREALQRLLQRQAGQHQQQGQQPDQQQAQQPPHVTSMRADTADEEGEAAADEADDRRGVA
ncbi:hypothetical protein WJX73_004472 [Symbiochloris irregularis]|uniref:Uncharacterized protein n=1 Tax=Symbiochloris irregularis TaxID=706552 RepID=A0AAW1NT85_9CHLO